VTKVADSTIVLESKLRPPRRPELFLRPRLLEEVDRFASCALTLVDAPVGFGKTVLVQSWCDRGDTPIAWVSLDAGDNDPARLWTHVATAVNRIREGLGRTALARLRTPRVPTEVAVEELLKGIAVYDAPLVIVLDDLHVVTNPECLGSLEIAIDRLPGNGRIVVATRSDPLFALGRLRGRGALGEIRARELAFDAEEIRSVLEREGIAADDEAVELLLERTEGWPAGVYLAALWLRTLDDPGAGIHEFHGHHRHVADYLSAEILDSLDGETRNFLVNTAVLERFTPSLCDAVLERTDSAARIAELERSNLFLVPLDARGEWYRYHHLFAELLRIELATDENASVLLHRRACRWCRQHELLEEALEHAAAAGDWETLAALLVDNHYSLVTTRPTTLLRWTELLPERILLQEPLLAVAGVHSTRGARRPPSEHARYTALAERARSERPETWTPYMEVAFDIDRVEFVESNLGEAEKSAHEALAQARAGVDQLMVATLASSALVAFFKGDLDTARTLSLEAVEYPSADARPHGYVYALALLSLLDGEMGLRTADARGRQALAEARRLGVDETTTGALAHIAMAWASSAAGRDREAEREALEGERLRRQPTPELLHAFALLTLAHTQARRGLLDSAEGNLSEAQAILTFIGDVGRLDAIAASTEREIDAARTGSVGSAEPLSDAEIGVLRLLATELSQREIAGQLFVSVNTVKTHTRLIYRKLGVGSRAEAVARAFALGVIQPDDSPG
jgi:LuxR family maltose regulon positive regulatory protein